MHEYSECMRIMDAALTSVNKLDFNGGTHVICEFSDEGNSAKCTIVKDYIVKIIHCVKN